MMLKFLLPDQYPNFFNIIFRVLKEDTSAPYRLTISRDSVHRTSIDLNKRKYLYIKKATSRQFIAGTITDADYADDIAIFANTHTQAESQLLRLDQAVGSTFLHIDMDKTECTCFNQEGAKILHTHTHTHTHIYIYIYIYIYIICIFFINCFVVCQFISLGAIRSLFYTPYETYLLNKG